jgi:hypothetical protein
VDAMPRLIHLVMCPIEDLRFPFQFHKKYIFIFTNRKNGITHAKTKRETRNWLAGCFDSRKESSSKGCLQAFFISDVSDFFTDRKTYFHFSMHFL